MSQRLKKAGLILVDVCLIVYIVLAFCAFNKPEEKKHLCKGVNVVVADASTHGFINSKEVKERIVEAGLDPKGKHIATVSCRGIEEALQKTPFVKTAECYKTEDGMVNVEVTQRMPIIRIKAANNDDFYIDDKDCIMPNSDFSSDLIIATGHISRSYATMYISPLARAIMDDDFSRNLFQQINVTPELGIELIPRVGGNLIYLGRLPESNVPAERKQLIEEFVKTKMYRLMAFYKYGLPKAGWNRYSTINLEFDNQIICKRK